MLNSVIIHCLVVGWERASSFGFSALGLRDGKNQMCLTERWLFSVCRTTNQYHPFVIIYNVLPLSRLVTNTYFSMIEDVEFNHQLFMQADASKNPEHLLYMMKEHHDKYRICGFCP